jgi:hypothetical protein
LFGVRVSYGMRMDERRGVVWIRQEFKVEVPVYRYTGSWQPQSRASTLVDEEGPGWNDVVQAIRWARQHAPLVFVQPFGTGEQFDAGERDGNAPSGRWPRIPRRRAGNRHPEYGGACYINEEPVWFRELGEFSASWLDEDKRQLEHATFPAVKPAIDWGRTRAPTVFVAEAERSIPDPLYRVRSAGDKPADPRQDTDASA